MEEPVSKDKSVSKYWKYHEKSLARDRRYKALHREELNEKRRQYYYAHRENQISDRIRYRRLNGETSTRRRRDLIELLGGKCVECAYSTDIRALCIDHINGKGRQDRKKFSGPLSYYRYYVNNSEEARLKLQVLCANCNIIKMSVKKEYGTGGRFINHTVTIRQ